MARKRSLALQFQLDPLSVSLFLSASALMGLSLISYLISVFAV